MSAETLVLTLEGLPYVAPQPPASAALLESCVEKGDLVGACGVAGELHKIESFNIGELPSDTTYLGMREAGSAPTATAKHRSDDEPSGRHHRPDTLTWFVMPESDARHPYDETDQTAQATQALSLSALVQAAAERVGQIEPSSMDPSVVTFFAPDGARHFIQHNDPDVLIGFLRSKGYRLTELPQEQVTAEPQPTVSMERPVTGSLDTPTVRIVARQLVGASVERKPAAGAKTSKQAIAAHLEATIGGPNEPAEERPTKQTPSEPARSKIERPRSLRRGIVSRFEQLQVIRYALGRIVAEQAAAQPERDTPPDTIEARVAAQATEALSDFVTAEDLHNIEPIFGREHRLMIRSALAALVETRDSKATNSPDRDWALAAKAVLKRSTIIESSNVASRTANRLRMAARAGRKKLGNWVANFGSKAQAQAKSNDPVLAAWLVGSESTR